MKKIILSIAVMAFAAITAGAQVKVEAGVNFSNYSNADTKLSSLPGARLAALVTVYDKGDFAVETGAGYVMDMVKNTGSNAKMTINNIQVPVRALYKFTFGEVGITPMIGMYFNYGLSGKTSVTEKLSGITVDTDPFEGDGGMRRFSFGFEDAIIVNYGRLSLAVGSQENLFPTLCKDIDITVDRHALFVSFGWTF